MSVVIDVLRSRAVRWGSLILAWTTLAIGLWHYSRVMWPITDVTGDDYWNDVLHLNGHCGRAKPPRDGWFFGAQSDFHGERLFRVAEAEGREAFQRVAPKLENLPPRKVEYVQKGIDVWLKKDRDRTDPLLLLACIHDARLDDYRDQPEMQEYVRATVQSFDDRWHRLQRYWLNIVFEAGYLGALILFLWWPWLRQAAQWRWALHIGLGPLLLFVPYYLGYAMLSFTTAAQPGGLLYSQVLLWFRRPLVWLIGDWNRQLPWTSLDGWLLANLPKPLASISQTPGEMMSISGGGGVGPVFLLELGAVLAVAIYAGPMLVRFVNARLRSTKQIAPS
jgi:hypothetical protein